MRHALAALFAVAAVAAPAAAFAQDGRLIVREPDERVIVREREERVIVRRAPDVVRRYVLEERRPSIVYEDRVVVGDVLPESVDTYEVPDSDYGYVVLNGERYIVDDDRRVVDVID